MHTLFSEPDRTKALAIIGTMSREQAIRICQWNDRNGSWEDDEDGNAVTLLEAHTDLLTMWENAQ